MKLKKNVESLGNNNKGFVGRLKDMLQVWLLQEGSSVFNWKITNWKQNAY